jgi:hypothetical protein
MPGSADYSGYTFINTGTLLHWALWGLGFCLACWCVCYCLCAAWAKARSVLRRRHADHALRAEAGRGVAMIEQYLAAHSAAPAGPESPDADGGAT